MTWTEGYGYGKSGVGLASDVYGAWQTGEKYEAEALAYKRNTLNEVERNKASNLLQEGAKDRAEFGASRALDAYMYSGEQKLDSIEQNLADNNAQLLMQTSMAYEQSLAVDETVGNMMSRNAIDAMKSEARLRVAAAGTGTGGGTTAQATMEARSIEMFDNAVLIGRASADKLNINRRLSMERLSNKNKNRYVASEIQNVFGASGAGAARQAGYAASYNTIPKSVKEGYLAHDVVKAEDTDTWLNSFFSYADIVIDASIGTTLGAMQDGTAKPEVGRPTDKPVPSNSKTKGKKTGVQPTSGSVGILTLEQQATWSDEDIAALDEATRLQLFGSK